MPCPIQAIDEHLARDSNMKSLEFWSESTLIFPMREVKKIYNSTEDFLADHSVQEFGFKNLAHFVAEESASAMQ